MVQIMLCLGVKFLGTIKNTAVVPLRIEDLNSKRLMNHNNKCYTMLWHNDAFNGTHENKCKFVEGGSVASWNW